MWKGRASARNIGNRQLWIGPNGLPWRKASPSGSCDDASLRALREGDFSQTHDAA